MGPFCFATSLQENKAISYEAIIFQMNEGGDAVHANNESACQRQVRGDDL